MTRRQHNALVAEPATCYQGDIMPTPKKTPILRPAKTRRTTRARLLRLAAFLETVPNRRFYMYSWFDDIKAGGVVCDLPPPTKTRCGTSACALGWATSIPAFRRAGLTVRMYKGDMIRPLFGRLEGEDAAKAFFGITTSEVEELFLGDQVTPKKKARELRTVAARYA